MKKQKGLFIVEEFNNFKHDSGAYVHTMVGYEQLSRYYNLVWLKSKKNKEFQIQNLENSISKSSFLKRKLHSIGIIGTIKDLLLLVQELISIPKKIYILKKRNIKFVYQRAHYLGYAWLVACKILKTPHFYEVNGIFSLDKSGYRKSLIYGIARFVEKQMYRFTDKGFFVGGINEIIGITGENAVIIQNGIDKEYLIKAEQLFNKHIVQTQNKIKIVFVGHIMQHHRLDLLIDALCLLNNPNNFELHILGKENPNVKILIPSDLNIKYYGVVKHSELPKILSQFQIGIIPYGKDYFSNMKLFTYCASHLLVIAPNTKNFKRIFSNSQVLFFENKNIKSLAKVLERVLNIQENERLNMINNAYALVKNNYTWEVIFRKKTDLINQFLK